MSEIELTKSEIEQAKITLAQALGISPDEIKTRQPEWLSLMRQGVIVSLHLRRWRATTTLTPEHLGLTFDTDQERESLEKTMKLGQVYLLPDRFIKRMTSTDSAARKSVGKYAYQTYWGSFLTADAFVEWKAEIEKKQAEYFAIRDDLKADWDSIIFEVADLHMANARAAYRREKQHSQASGRSSQVIEQYSEGAFVSKYTDAILEAIPGATQVYDSFGFDIDLSYIPLPSLLAEDQAKAESAWDKLQDERQQSQAEQRMRSEVMANYKGRVDELVTDHLRRMVAQLNEFLYQAASDVLDTTQTNERLHPRSVVQLKAAIDRIKALNILDYDDITRMVNQAETILDTTPDNRSVKQVESKLKDIALVTRATLVGLGERQSRGGGRGEFQNVDVPAADNVRQARARLGLAEIIEPEQAYTRQARQAQG